MLVWWLLGRPAAGSVPFAALAFAVARRRGGADGAAAAGARPSGGGRRRRGGRHVARAPEPRRGVLVLRQHGPVRDGVRARRVDRGGARAPLGSRPPRRSPRICRRSRPTCCRCSRCSSCAACPGGAGSWRSRRSSRCSPSCWRRAARCCTDGVGRATRAPGSRPRCFRLPAGSPTFSPATAWCPEPLAFGLGTAVVALAAFAAIRGPAEGRRRGRAAVRVLRARGAAAAGRRLGRGRALFLSARGRAGLGGGGGAGWRGRRRAHHGRGRPAAGGRPAGRPAARRRGLVRTAGRGGAAGGRRRPGRRGIACSTS